MSKTHFAQVGGYQYAGLLARYDFGKPIGNVFFVHSGTGTNSSGYGFSPEAPVASIDYAVGLCTADNDDYIVVMPGHTETITAAAGLDLDVAGITIIGLGNGRSRPKINFTTAATADMDVDAANIRMENLFFDLTSIDSLDAAIDVNSPGFHLKNCEFELADATGQCDVAILTDATAVRLIIEDCYFHGAGDTTAVLPVSLVGGDDSIIRNNIFDGYFGTTGAIQNATTAAVNLNIIGNTITNRTADGNNKTIVVDASTVAVISNNRGSIIDSTGPAPVTAAASFVSGNYWSSAAGVAASVLM